MKTFVLTDESLNSFGFWLPLAGADLEQFKKNPLMLWMHKRSSTWDTSKDEILPIGHWENIRIEGKKLLADAAFDENDEFAMRISDKVENTTLRMASAGIKPIETSTDPKWLKPGQTCETPIRWKMKEASICDLGANDNAMALAFYDENDNLINLSENNKAAFPLRKLSDIKPVTQINNDMKKLLSFLKLSDDSTEDQVLAKVQELTEKVSTAETAKTTAETALAELKKKDVDAKKAEGTTLMDAAVKDGRMNADSRKGWESLFEKDHDSAKIALAAIPVRKSIKDQLDDGKDGSEKERDAFVKLSWDELDKSGKLRTLKEKFADIYEEKFEEKYGIKPNK